MPAQITGVVASLKWGYAHAATLGAWSAESADQGWRLSAKIESVDMFRVAQRPLVFEARHATGAFRWPVLELQVGEGALTARLGPREG